MIWSATGVDYNAMTVTCPTDASYEGDIIVSAGVSTTFGRESKAKYNEAHAGVTASSMSQFKVEVDATWSNGTLLTYVQSGSDPRTRVGDADQNLMAYSFRACLTKNETNKVPVPKPEGYRTTDFELARRHVLAELQANRSLRLPWGNLAYKDYPPRSKFDACCRSGPVGIDAVGLDVG